MRSRRFGLGALLAMGCAALMALALVGVSPGGAASAPAASASRLNVGTVPGTDAFAAIVTRDGKAVAYICDGKKLAVWLKGTFVNGQLNLASRAGATLTGTLAKGTLKLRGRDALRVRVAFAPQRGTAAFFTGKATIGKTRWAGGWITLADGRQRGSLRKGNGAVFATAAVTPATQSVALPGGGSLGVSEYQKCWECLPAREGGAATT